MAQERTMSEERKEQLRQAALRRAASTREVKHDLSVNREDYVNSADFRGKFSNSQINTAVKIVDSERIKWKLNEDGTPMTIDDEIQFRQAKGMKLLAHHLVHLKMALPPEEDDETEEEAEAA